MKMREMHHFYFGGGMLAGAWIMLFVGAPALWCALMMIGGLWLVVDDMWQHWVQREYDDSYRSPVNRLWRFMLRGFKSKE